MPDVPVGQDLQRRLQSLPLLAKELLAGGVAGGLSKSSIAPLERVKILFQTGRNEGRGVMGMLVNIVQTEGPIGLFRGNGASVLRIVPYAALNFTAYERYRSALITAFGLTEQPLPLPTTSSQTSSHHDDPHAHQVPAQPAPYHPIPPLLDLLAGSAAGATAVAITYPLDLVRTRLAYNIAPGMPPGPVPPADAVKAPSGQTSSSPQARQYSSRSASSSSTPACSARHAGSPADSAHLRQYSSGAPPHSNPRSTAPQPSWQGSRGACASALADLQGRELPSPSRSGERARPQSSGLAATPGQARGMSASAGGSSPLSTGLPSATSRPSPSSIMGMLRMVLHTEGVVGLYRGISPTILGILPYAGLKFYVYQSLKQIYQGPYARHEKLPILTTLGFGAVSGLAAQTVTYPLDIVRRRMQVQGQVLAPRTSIMSGFRELLASGGVKALFRGLSLNYIKVVPATAIGFTVYDGMKYYLNITHLA